MDNYRSFLWHTIQKQKSELLGVKEISKIVKSGNFSEKIIIRIPIKNLYYSYDEVNSMWKSRLLGGLFFPADEIITIEEQ